MRFRLFALPLALAAAPAFAWQAPPADPAPEERPAGRGSDMAAEFVTGVEFQSGDYFTGERVDLLTVQNVGRLRIGRTVVSASLPWHRIEAPGNVVGGGGGLLGLPILVDPTQPATRDVRQGIGDVRLGVGHTLPPLAGAELTLSGQVKLPTASSERGIGTGETDVAVGAELVRSFGPVTPFVAVGYTIAGEPEAYELRNSLSARGGVALQLGQGLRANVGYGFAESVSPLVPDQRQISTGLNASLSRRLNLGLHGNVGLSEGSPDLGAGVSLGVRIF
jgi:hypothetical protein